MLSPNDYCSSYGIIFVSLAFSYNEKKKKKEEKKQRDRRTFCILYGE